MRTTCFLLATLALTVQSAVASDAYADVNAMRAAFSHIRSVTAVERFSTGDIATVEYRAPDRFHVTMAKSQILLAGNVEYDKRTGGAWKRSSLGAEHQALVEAAWQLAGPPDIDLHKLFTITMLISKTIDGLPVRGYLMHDAAGAYDETVWIGPNHLPVAARIQTPDETLEIHYIGYNGSVLIAMP